MNAPHLHPNEVTEPVPAPMPAAETAPPSPSTSHSGNSPGHTGTRDRDGGGLKSARKGNWEDKQVPRSTPHSGALLLGALSIAASWVSLLAVMVLLALKFSGHPGPWMEWLLPALCVFGVSFVLGLVLSLTKQCPLCRGTPLHNQRCFKHRLAQRWPLLTYRATTVLRILTTLRFRCMYCGTPFRLFKKPSHRG